MSTHAHLSTLGLLTSEDAPAGSRELLDEAEAAISRFNGCEYCMGARSAIADGNKVPTEVTDAVRAGEPIGDDRLQTLNLFTTTMVATRGRPSDVELVADPE
ncbi:MAG: hypothetical protein ABIP19_03895 [Dermatophilaceae bacterium]